MATYSERRCREFIDIMSAVVANYTAGDPHGGHQNDGWPTTSEVLECITEAGLTVPDFIELDERPGHFDPRYRQNGWHRLLRQVRNDPTINLFGDVLGTPLPATTGPSLFRRT